MVKTPGRAAAPAPEPPPSSTKSVVQFTAGGFRTVPKPDWWEAEWERLFAVAEGQAAVPEWRFGAPPGHGQAVHCFRLSGDHGWMVDFEEGDHIITAWCQDDAALLELSTTRTPAWLNLGGSRPMNENVEHLRNAVIAYARHGGGEAVSAADGMHEADRPATAEEGEAAPGEDPAGF